MKPTWMWIALTAAILCVSCTRAANIGTESTIEPEASTVTTESGSTETTQSTVSTESTSPELVTGTSTDSSLSTQKSTSTPEPEGTTESGSETTAGSTTPAPPKCGRKFDAWSFVGGMLLVGGIVIIMFVAWKYYKSKTEARYHQF